MAKFNDYLKSIFLILMLMQFAPPIFKSLKKQIFDNIEPKNKVGLIIIDEPITSSTCLTKQLKDFFKDSEIKAILLKIDCGGGAAGTSQALALEVAQLKKQYPKPIVTYTENICASGAYYIACMTDYIVATGSSIVGSIGAKIPTQFKLKELLENYKVKTESIASGAYKNVLDPFTQTTEEQKIMLQKLTDDCYEQFTSDVAKQRHLSLQAKSVWAEGKVFTGAEAKNLQLVDEIGNLTTATDYIKKNILHTDREIQLIKKPKPSIIQKFLNPSDDIDQEQDCSLSESFCNGFWKYLERKTL